MRIRIILTHPYKFNGESPLSLDFSVANRVETSGFVKMLAIWSLVEKKTNMEIVKSNLLSSHYLFFLHLLPNLLLHPTLTMKPGVSKINCS